MLEHKKTKDSFDFTLDIFVYFYVNRYDNRYN